MSAVADKRDENNRQYLVGYYTADVEIDEKILRQHLSAKLPKYMVPNYFMRLEAMPMTPSGKTDRKNLPIPEISNHKIEYIAPTTDNEKGLLRFGNVFYKLSRLENRMILSLVGIVCLLFPC